MGGYKCDQCARGYLGEAPYCSPCGECFDNWDEILDTLKDQTSDLIERAKKIKTQGATGAYTKEFDDIERKIGNIKNILDNTTISSQDIDDVDQLIASLRTRLDSSENSLKESEGSLDKFNEIINLANVEIENLKEQSKKVKDAAFELKENATKLQEANVEGALNLTREAWHRVQFLSEIHSETQELNAEAERQCKRIESLIKRQPDNEKFSVANDDQINDLQANLDELNAKIPDLNEQVCDKRGDPCDSLCGGAGCGKCGGLSCEKGALTRAEQALNYAKDAEKIIKDKEELAENLIRSVNIKNPLIKF
jgi:laminin beta 1